MPLLAGYDRLYRETSFGGHARKISPPNDAFEDAVKAAMAAHPDASCVLTLTHQNIKDDTDLAAKLAKMSEIRVAPLILGGHDHKGHEDKEGDVHIIKAPENAEAVFVIDLKWEEGGGPVPKVVNVERVQLEKSREKEPKYKEKNPDIADLVKKKSQCVEELKQKVLLKPESVLRSRCVKRCGGEKLSSKNARAQECSVGTLLATALRDGAVLCKVKGPDGKAVKECHGALINGGSVRKNSDYEDTFTVADLMDELSFPDPYIPVLIKGSVLSEAVKFSRNTWGKKEGEEGYDPRAGKCLHFDDKMKADPETHELVEVNGEPIDMEKEYTILMSCRLYGSNTVLKKFAKARRLCHCLRV